MDVLIDAAVRLRAGRPDLTVAIAGRGRDSDRLAGRIAEYSAPVRLLGGVTDADLPRLVGAADVFVMLCRNRWMGLEQEGFGIVFLEAAAAGVPQVAGRLGGCRRGGGGRDHRHGGPADHRRRCGGTGHRRAVGRSGLRERMGRASRRRAEASFDYDKLAPRLAAALADVEG